MKTTLRNLLEVDRPHGRQAGVATLFVTLMVMVGMTLATVFTTRAVLNEQRISANQYRYQQAFSAAKAALDEGIAYYKEFGVQYDHDSDPSTPPQAYTSATASTTNGLLHDPDSDEINGNIFRISTTIDGKDFTLCTQWSFVCEHNSPPPIYVDCSDANAILPPIAVEATGYSDDYQQTGVCDPGTAFQDGGGNLLAAHYGEHTITQRLDVLSLVGGGGTPHYPLIARGNVGITGGLDIVNAYYNATVWAGDSVGVGMSNTASTWIDNPSDTTDPGTVTIANYNTGSPSATVMASGRNLGNNVDIIPSDPGLFNLSEPEFFENFFNESKTVVKALAVGAGKVYDSGNPPPTTVVDPGDGSCDSTGIIWIDGDITLDGERCFGWSDQPVTLIVDGNLTAQGTMDIVGLLYVAGDWALSGEVNITGAVFVAGTATGATGGATILYSPDSLLPAGAGDGGIGGEEPYSWKDFF